MERQNITLSIPKNLLKQAKHMAVERGVSVSALLAGYIEEIVTKDQEYWRAARRIRERLKKGYDLGLNGRVSWKRDELHER